MVTRHHGRGGRIVERTAVDSVWPWSLIERRTFLYCSAPGVSVEIACCIAVQHTSIFDTSVLIPLILPATRATTLSGPNDSLYASMHAIVLWRSILTPLVIADRLFM
jgi:hypothetical protein